MRNALWMPIVGIASAVLGAAWLASSAPGYGQDAPVPNPKPPAAADTASATVRAQRYRLTVYDSALDTIHCMGREIVELYFPDAGIVCNLATGFASDCPANAFYGASRAEPIPEALREELGDNAPPRVVPEEIRVPGEVFDRIRALADVTKRRTEAATALVKAVEGSDLFARAK